VSAPGRWRQRDFHKGIRDVGLSWRRVLRHDAYRRQCFGESFCLHLQGASLYKRSMSSWNFVAAYKTTRCHNIDGSSFIYVQDSWKPHYIIKLYAPCILYIGQTYRYSPEYSFYIFSQQIYYLIIFLDFLSPSSFIPPQNVVYFLMLPFLVH
jgi:hypothetical protein